MTEEKPKKKYYTKKGRNPNSDKNLWKPIKPGEVRNPNGRPKGSRNKFSEAFCHDLLLEWEEGGREAMAKVRKNDPSTFLKVASTLIPKHFSIKDDRDFAFDKFVSGLEDDELDQLITGLCTIGSTAPGITYKKQEDIIVVPDKIQ